MELDSPSVPAAAAAVAGLQQRRRQQQWQRKGNATDWSANVRDFQVWFSPKSLSRRFVSDEL
jgi:hypothetical protein